MGLFGKKNIFDLIKKNFIEKQIEFDIKENVISFSLNLGDNIIFPNIKIDDVADELTFIINIKKGESKNLKEFNNKSKYLKALSNEGITYLYYRTFVTTENVLFVIDTILSSLTLLENDIINL